MPWHIEMKGDEWCVIKDADGSSAGCHATKSRATAQLRALYANESSTASVNGHEEERVENELLSATLVSNNLVSANLVSTLNALMERMQASEQALTASLEAIVQEFKNDREEMVQALTASASAPAPVVNVNVPETPPPSVNVEIPPATDPQVNVAIEDPPRTRRVIFERSPEGRLTGATIEELDE
jgi:hypothetical protein